MVTKAGVEPTRFAALRLQALPLSYLVVWEIGAPEGIRTLVIHFGRVMPEAARPPVRMRKNGAEEIRTLDPLRAKQMLYQLSYSPEKAFTTLPTLEVRKRLASFRQTERYPPWLLNRKVAGAVGVEPT